MHDPATSGTERGECTIDDRKAIPENADIPHETPTASRERGELRIITPLYRITGQPDAPAAIQLGEPAPRFRGPAA